MKTMKVALLATAALAAVSVSARADDSADIKAQLEALNARIAQLEAAPAVPTGYNLLAFGEKDAFTIPSLDSNPAAGTKANTISIVPSADMPAAAEIQWSGYVRAAIVYRDGVTFENNGDADAGIYVRGQLNVAAKTDTSVGEVGVKMSFRAQQAIDTGSRGVNNGVVAPEYWGYWAVTPEWTLGGGYTGSLAAVPYGYDAACSCYVVDSSQAMYLNPGDAKQLRLSYASGPLSFGIAIEDGTDPAFAATTDDALGVAARLKYDGDAFSMGLTGGYWSPDDNPDTSAQTEWMVGGGASFSLGDMASITIGTGYFRAHNNTKTWNVNGAIIADLTDAVSVELGAGMDQVKGGSDQYSVSGGVYWTPVDQLRIGAEAEWFTVNDDDNFGVGLVTVYSF